MAAKKKVAVKKRSAKATLQFSIDEAGQIVTEQKIPKSADKRLACMVQHASNLLLADAVRAGGVLVNIAGKLTVAKPLVGAPELPKLLAGAWQ